MVVAPKNNVVGVGVVVGEVTELVVMEVDEVFVSKVVVGVGSVVLVGIVE
jgi:hypothetical protein